MSPRLLMTIIPDPDGRPLRRFDVSYRGKHLERVRAADISAVLEFARCEYGAAALVTPAA